MHQRQEKSEAPCHGEKRQRDQQEGQAGVAFHKAADGQGAVSQREAEDDCLRIADDAVEQRLLHGRRLLSIVYSIIRHIAFRVKVW